MNAYAGLAEDDLVEAVKSNNGGKNISSTTPGTFSTRRDCYFNQTKAHLKNIRDILAIFPINKNEFHNRYD